MFSFAACSLLFLFQTLVNGQATPFPPPAYPLAVRSPYLSSWLGQQGSGTALNDDWPKFWTGQITGWAGFIRVDDAMYSFLGTPNFANAKFRKAKQTSAKFTSTQTQFIMSAGPVDLSITFLSPVEPDDLTKHSFPFSYMALSASSTNDDPHTVSLYTDITGEWLSADIKLPMNWTTTTEDDIVIHQGQLQEPHVFGEISDRAQYGSVYYATSATDGLTYQTGGDAVVRALFQAAGALDNSQDTDFRSISENWPVLAFAHDLGRVKEATEPFVVAIGHVRDPVIQYIRDDAKMEERSLYFFSKHESVIDAIPSFVKDYKEALSRADAFDKKVEDDASKVSEDYAALVALSIRQAFAATEITIPRSTDGSWNTDDILMFMKEISSNGNMNTVDVIFPTWPLYLYTNPDLGKYLLNVLLEYQASGQYPNDYSIHDVGTHYPNATGHNDGKDQAMPVEESGNMIIMALSYAQKTGDTSVIKKYYKLLDQWAQFLITESLKPSNQQSTDDFAGHLELQTNLAIKGIIGIKAMSIIADALGDSSKSEHYSSLATSYVKQWQELAMSSEGDHLTLSYGNDSSWGLTYNLYAEKLLGLELFPNDILDTQTAWYEKQAKPFGVPLDSRATYTKTDWEIWTAAIVTNTGARDMLIKAVIDSASSGKGASPLRDFYETTDGSPQGFTARPVVGGHLALLVLGSDSKLKPAPEASSTTTTSSPESTSNTDSDGQDGTSTNTDDTDSDDDSASLQTVPILTLAATSLLLFIGWI